jgi:hypothetical protein
VTAAAPREDFRQWPTVQKIATVQDEDEFLGAFLVGSFAADAADSVSDVDLIVVALDGAFSAARGSSAIGCMRPGALASWDEHDGVFEEAAVHVWLTPDIVLVEALIATLSSGAPGIPTRMCGQVTVG